MDAKLKRVETHYFFELAVTSLEGESHIQTFHVALEEGKLCYCTPPFALRPEWFAPEEYWRIMKEVADAVAALVDQGKKGIEFEIVPIEEMKK